MRYQHCIVVCAHFGVHILKLLLLLRHLDAFGCRVGSGVRAHQVHNLHGPCARQARAVHDVAGGGGGGGGMGGRGRKGAALELLSHLHDCSRWQLTLPPLYGWQWPKLSRTP